MKVQATQIPAPDEIEAEWRRRAGRPGLARVMRASQPAELAEATTIRTRQLVTHHLRSLGPIRSALEIGCGMGRITPAIAAQAGAVTAIDMTPRMLELARAACAHLPGVEFRQAAVQRLPWRDKRFDVAVCVWVLMHVLDDDEIAWACRAISGAARHLVLVEYEHADIPVGRYSRLRDLDDYLALLPGSRLVERHELTYGGDRSFAALIALEDRR
ncbi:class I SAM-dependent methyltransferase [Lentzea flaviverrucosa]|uniref:Methyltransferase domain-containing protein n=1 Tax=Lentzea flaviverrucosa TaxID=200379 RepID=A0A1H9XWM9_9PSEU|nr:class I SAM-dependent methyltransferase [Lentzea flaviverrucosa]RDI34278.1 methyltransferase family protein [Lentzea flaviverrucosa]SES50551.1 Methyltransferase domain-containing protein [Lentzea flaviverrucosa]